MNPNWNFSIVLLITGLFFTGCETNDRLFFATKTNYGLDLDTTPATAELTIARRELAIAPTFRDAGEETTLPLLASFGLSGKFADPEITSRFAGGDAAVFLSEGPDGSHKANSASLCLSSEPDMLPFWKWAWQKITFQKGENTRDFYFATDTSFGIKAGWSGATGPYPTTLKIGYNRKEFAFPPIFAKGFNSTDCSPPSTATSTPDKPESKSWQVTVPSFVASMDNDSAISGISDSTNTHVQFFATGKAANALVARREVNSALNKSMYPHNEFAIAPESVGLTVEGTKTFQATGGKGQVRFTMMHDKDIAGDIDPATGAYKAKQTPGVFIVGASDKAGNFATATVTVYPTLTPPATTLHIVAKEKTLQITATGGVPPLKYTISNNKSGSTIDLTGLYTASSNANKTDTVTVTDSASPPNSVTTEVTIQ